MRDNTVTVTVYGADQICPSSVAAPGSKDTYIWLQVAFCREYADDGISNAYDVISYEYVDIEEEQSDEKHQRFVERVFEEELFYPVVLVNDELVAEGIPRLKTIYKALDKYGVELLAK